MMDIHKEKLMAKVENMAVTYEKYRLIPLDEIACVGDRRPYPAQ